jgi:hypothetical protein
MGKEHASAGMCPWAAGGADAVAGRRAARRGGVPVLNMLLTLCSKLKNSKFLNKSAPNVEYESWRSHTHLQLSQRLYGDFAGRVCQLLNATQMS